MSERQMPQDGALAGDEIAQLLNDQEEWTGETWDTVVDILRSHGYVIA